MTNTQAVSTILAFVGAVLVTTGVAAAAGGANATCTGVWVEEFIPDESHPEGGRWEFVSWSCSGSCAPASGDCMKHRYLAIPGAGSPPVFQWSCSCNDGGNVFLWSVLDGLVHQEGGATGTYPTPDEVYCDLQTAGSNSDGESSMCPNGLCEGVSDCERYIVSSYYDTSTPPRYFREYACACAP